MLIFCITNIVISFKCDYNKQISHFSCVQFIQMYIPSFRENMSQDKLTNLSTEKSRKLGKTIVWRRYQIPRECMKFRLKE